MAANAEQAREMLRLARDARIKLMVNYWNLWAPATEEIHARIEAGEIGPVQKIIAEYGHRGPKEIGVSKYFAEWLYDPAKNGGGALVDFGCYGADWTLWLKGRPKRVYAYSLRLKTEQHNPVEDDAVIYFVWCIRNHKPIEGAAAAELNVAVNEILDAAKEAIRTGRVVELGP